MKKNKIKKLSEYNVTKIRHILKTYFKYMFVRHPLDRIHLAYCDKLIYEMFIDTYGNYYWHLVPRILKLVRPDLLNQSLQSIHLPFDDVL